MHLGERYLSRQSGVATAMRPLLTFFCILAIFFQAYITQTHIHVAGSRDAYTVSQSAVAQGTDGPRAPDQSPQDDLNKCPLCQAAVAAGAVIGPPLVYLVQPMDQGIVLGIPELRQPAAQQPAHVWNSRGPPLR